ncbi:MAG TPA: hypothetical protein VD788_09940 [Candidatus Polarisedimenticolaceae bacterium]|nr:hypothetical protein [Candidatus Polarisedimenticolaceae bacterium]
MRNKLITTIVLVAAACLPPVAADVPPLLSYQGRIVDSMGSPVVDPTLVRFRVYRGGDGTSVFSSGLVVYDELVWIEPSPNGVFSHSVGSGTAAPSCDDGPCALSAGDFGDGVEPIWIEVRVDPDGEAGTPDDDLLLPRTRIGTVGFAYRVASLDGAEGGALAGAVTADTLVGRTGATFGDGSASDVALTFDGAAGDPTIRWVDSLSEFAFSASTRHEAGLSLAAGRSIAIGPFDNPTEGAYLRMNHTAGLAADGNLDGTPDANHVFALCYNCAEGSSGAELPSEYTMAYQWAMTNAPLDGQRSTSQTWTFRGPGMPAFRPYLFSMDLDAAGGYASPTAKWTFSNSPGSVALHINQNGNVKIGADSPQPTYPLDVEGTIHATEDLRLEPSRGVTFGSTPALVDDSASSRLLVGGGYTRVQLGNGTGEVNLNFGSDLFRPRIQWLPAFQRFTVTDETLFSEGITIGPLKTISYGPFTNPVPDTYIRYYKTADQFADGNLDGLPDEDHVVGVCYNCGEGGSGGPQVTSEYALRAQWEMSYAPVDGERVVEHNWNFLALGKPLFRPLLFYLDVDQDGNFAEPWAKWTFSTERGKVAFHINQNGNVVVGSDSPQPTRQLEVRGDAAVEGGLVLGACDDAAAAGTLNIASCNLLTVHGASTVNRVNTCDDDEVGRVLYLLCGNDATVLCDGDGSRCSSGNLRLAGDDADFVCSPDDVLTLMCDGFNWRQVAVSAN